MKTNQLRKICILLMAVGLTSVSKAQVKIGANPTLIDARSTLELEDSTRALLINRLTTTQRNTQTGWKAGHLIYNTTDSCFQFYNGLIWDCLQASSDTSGSSSGGGSTSSVAQTVISGNQIASHNNGSGSTTAILETVTQMRDNSDGTYTYTREDGDTQRINTTQKIVVTGSVGNRSAVTCLQQVVPGTNLVLTQGYWTIHVAGNVTGPGPFTYGANISPYLEIAMEDIAGSMTYLDPRVKQMAYANSALTSFGITFVVNVTTSSATFRVRTKACSAGIGNLVRITSFSGLK